VLLYDGVEWQRLNAPDLVRSLSVHRSGRIYTGGYARFGYLEQDSTGNWTYRSLSDQAAARYPDMADVWSIHNMDSVVCFRTSRYLFVHRDTQMTVIRAQNAFRQSAVIGSGLYIWDPGTGLVRFDSDGCRLAVNGENFAQRYVHTMCAWGNDSLLIMTSEGFVIYHQGAISAWGRRSPVFDESPYYMSVLSNHHVVVTTLNGGAWIFDERGAVVDIFDRRTGLPTFDVKFAAEDGEGGLWLALNQGMVRVPYPSRETFFDVRLGVENAVDALVRHHGSLYAASNSGVLRQVLSDKDGRPSRFERWGPPILALHLASTHDGLLVASGDGIFLMQDQPVDISGSKQRAAFMRSWSRDSTVIFVGMKEGLGVVRYRNGNWSWEGRLPGIHEQIRSLTESIDGILWCGTRSQGALRIRFDTDSGLHKPAIRRLGEKDGLPPGGVRVARISGEIRLSTDRGLFRWDDASETVMPDSTFGMQFVNGSMAVDQMYASPNGDVWIVAVPVGIERNVVMRARRDGSTWHVNDRSYRHLLDFPCYTVFPDGDSLVWFAGSKGIIRHQLKTPAPSPKYGTLIQRLLVRSDSIVYTGGSMRQVQLPYHLNAIRIQFASPNFERTSENEFQYCLEGFDAGWSSWTLETKKDYTNLPEGRYTFRVRARNVHRQEMPAAELSLVILPPWYRTPWAYALYVLATLSLLFTLVRWRTLALQRHKVRLERIVDERTEELRARNRQIAEQAHRLEELDRIKSRFFANISHEFRTPLTLVMGPLRQLMAEDGDARHRSWYDLMMRQSSRLLALINQLLDLAKLENRSMTARWVKGDIILSFRGWVMSFFSLAETRRVRLILHTPDEAPELLYDADKLEKIVVNLLSNAFKFTPPDGVIETSLALRDGMIEITVSDTGKGIPAEQLSRIFDRFYQVDSSETRGHEGSGIGLALVKEMTDYLGGKVDVESEVDKGTTFRVAVPFGTGVESEFASVAEEASVDLGERIDPDLSSSPPEGCPSILIVEDQPDMRVFIRSCLGEHYLISEAVNGENGFEIAKEQIPDLIISDVMMPVMDGYEFTRRTREDIRTSHIPVILLTARADETHRIEGLETGADDYISKPFSARELAARVRNLIEQRKKLREVYGKQAVLEPASTALSSADRQFLEKVNAAIATHLDDPDFSVDALSELVFLSRSQLHRKLTALIDQAPTTYIRSVRLQHALERLKKRDGSITEIAFDVGFSNLSYFSKCFKEQFGVLPSEI
jgi:signal transduction histidine kinase/DNA-binding response OmpR family regulator